MTFLLNLVWLIFGGGLLAAFGWAVSALLMAISIIGLPWTPAALRVADYTLLPFGRRIETAPTPVSLAGNIIWFILAGWWLALGHLLLAIGLAVTIIGIPFAWAHLKLAYMTLAPVGTTVVSTPPRRRAF
ncbi:YccF domain-containing protein [Telmatospirillum siberiense]|uniref:Inner membrane protein YccF n=1 Tax=Telmatospirillum siberiense TaxID=382514 RepID=A0A2N3PWM6_9PROT|nr:YccF domain-containing protein [Telmatospirillum siberiense]PKU24813.1 YccF domain-containing protein [Telmatospirillum siberiense]